ncbi:Gfo/Idh/MocA family protein [Clostridium sp. YIM B02551]|uniref:Gfo/Idh/MocA family protein n=1 Tax=Clostridium sp. YIM B02551 TaxID=2910679 RepID=UPI001EEB4388|nr:Gfo/Idh/MocA family oxidoreductase [Clostridium sp. YIM B02551]
MVRFGVVGTNWITEAFIKGASLNKDFKLTAVYSRNYEKGKEFADKYSVDNIFTDINKMAASNVIDAVYIASPNSLHAPQAIIFLNNKKHVISEKAFASNEKEALAMINAANENNVLLMEAMKITLLPGFEAIKANLSKIGTVRRFTFSYCQYSSRYDKYKQGEILNAFDPKFSNGSLMDIGVYCIHPMIHLFGTPKNIKASGLIFHNGIDGEGSLIAEYDGMDGILTYSKISNSYIPSEIQGEKGSILINSITTQKSIKIIYNNGETEDISVPQIEDDMYYEANEFISLINENKLESSINSHNRSLEVIRVTENVRKQIGLVFPADNL